MSMLPLAMIDDGLSPRTFGVVIALNGLLIVLGQPLVTRLLATRREALVGAGGRGGDGSRLRADRAGTHPGLVRRHRAALDRRRDANAPSNAALLAGLSPVDMRGRYQGAYGLSWQAASFLAPTLGGAVRELAGNTVLWLGCLGLGPRRRGVEPVAAPARERRVAVMTAAAKDQDELVTI